MSAIENQDASNRFGRIAIQVGFASALASGALWLFYAWLQNNYEPDNLHAPYASTALVQTLAFGFIGMAALAFFCGLVVLRFWKTLIVSVSTPVILYMQLNVCCVDGRRPTRESLAVANLRTVNTAQVIYQSASGVKFGAIPDLIAADILDSSFAGNKNGYRYRVDVASDGKEYTATAEPVNSDYAGLGFYTTAEGIVRYALTRSSTCTPCFPRYKSGQPVQ